MCKSRLFKQPAVDKLWVVFVEFVVELFNRAHFVVPSLSIKELIVSKCFCQNILLIPQLPEMVEPNDKKKQIALLDIKLNGGKREDYNDSAKRLEKWANVLFSQFRCKAYVGRAW